MATLPSSPHYVVIDLTFPLDSALAETCLLAVENAVTWACFLCEEVTNFGIICINSGVHSVCKPVTLNGNSFSWVAGALQAIFKQFISVRVTPADFKDLLLLAVRMALEEQPTASLTVISCREGRLIAEWLDTLPTDQAAAADSFQVVELSRNEPRQPSFSVCHPHREGRPIVCVATVPAGARGESQLQATTLEATLRAVWFTPRWSEMTPLQLNVGQAVDLECVASQSVADPSSLPVAAFFLIPGAAAGGGGADRGRSVVKHGGAKEVLQLQALCRVAADGVCEGSLFGAPLRVLWSPPSTFRGNGQEYRQNAHMFLALCESLSDADEFLVLKRQGGSQAIELGGHFIAMPGDECLLVRAVASAELALPAPPPPPLQYDGSEAARAAREVRDALDGLAVAAQYSAKRFPSHLCAALKLTARFPERLSLGSLACHGHDAVTAPTSKNKCLADQDPEVVSDEELAEENARPLGPLAVHSVPSRAAPVAPALLAPAHKLGTGGHPALDLDSDSRLSAKRKKAPPLFGVSKARRH